MGANAVALRTAWGEPLNVLSDNRLAELRLAIAGFRPALVIHAGGDPARSAMVARFFGAPALMVSAITGGSAAIAAVVTAAAAVGLDSWIELSPANAKWITKTDNLVYDPSAFLLGSAIIDPYAEVYAPRRRQVRAVAVLDGKRGHGFRPPGRGDGQLDRLVGESRLLLVDSPFGDSYGDVRGRAETFQLCWLAAESLVEAHRCRST